jgi:hypothetical protein
MLLSSQLAKKTVSVISTDVLSVIEMVRAKSDPKAY